MLAVGLVLCAAPLGGQRDQPRFGSGPWVLLEKGGGAAPAPSAGFAGTLFGPRNLRLDSGSTATFRVQHQPCLKPEDCDAPDCGCHGADRYRLSIADDTGALVATTLLWAAYGTFDVIPVDLVDGPGDELLIVRSLGRSSPPNGMDLKILRIEGTQLRELLATHQIAGNFSGRPMVCGQWRSRVVIDAEARKPRPIRLDNEIIVAAGCTLDAPADADEMRRRSTTLGLQGGRYVAR